MFRLEQDIPEPCRRNFAERELFTIRGRRLEEEHVLWLGMMIVA